MIKRETISALSSHRFWRRIFATTVVLVTAFVGAARAGRLDEMAVDRWKKLREVEVYQLNIAEKYYKERNWKVAAAEYEKYLTLYERSEAASYAQLKWSICQSGLKNKHTAITDGFQSVVDYWPNSADAVSAAYYIGKTYEDIGEVAKAKKAYKKLLADYGKQDVAAYALDQLLKINAQENNADECVELEKKLTFDINRESDREIRRICEGASRDLARHYFENAALNEGVKALETTYNQEQIVGTAVSQVTGVLRNLIADSKTKAKGEKLADFALGYIKTKIPQAKTTPEEKQKVIEHWYYLADVNAAAGRDQDVIAVYEEMLKKFGSDDAILGRYAGWWKSIKQYDKARQTYGLYQDKIESQNQIARSYRDERKVELAVRTYQNLVAADQPENAPKWLEQMAATYDENNQFPKAIEVYQQLLKQDADNTQKWLWNLAYDYERSQQYKLAIGHYRQCTNFPSNYQRMAGCHRALKEYGEAIVLYNQIVGGSESTAPWAALQIGYTLEQAGKKEQAIKQFQGVCQRYPKDGHASQAHAHLQNEYKITVTLGGAKDGN